MFLIITLFVKISLLYYLQNDLLVVVFQLAIYEGNYGYTQATTALLCEVSNAFSRDIHHVYF